ANRVAPTDVALRASKLMGLSSFAAWLQRQWLWV
ncbi:MAG: hypothetical protein ACI8R9_002439, partial [Paraglaciecola sp.]